MQQGMETTAMHSDPAVGTLLLVELRERKAAAGPGGAAAASPPKARPGLAPATPRTAGNCPGHAVPHIVLSRCSHLTCRATYEIISMFGGKNKYLIVVMAIICIQMFSRVRIPH